MRVTYQFDCHPDSNDEYEWTIYQRAPKMHKALEEISNVMRAIRKGWEELTIDDLEERISNMISESGFYEIE